MSYCSLSACQPAAWLAMTFPINLTGQPAATVPAGWTSDGLPVGLQIVGQHLDDAMVLPARRPSSQRGHGKIDGLHSWREWVCSFTCPQNLLWTED